MKANRPGPRPVDPIGPGGGAEHQFGESEPSLAINRTAPRGGEGRRHRDFALDLMSNANPGRRAC